MARKHTLIKTGIIVTLIVPTFFLSRGYIAGASKDYSTLIGLIQLEDKIKPLFVFEDPEEEFDENSHRESLEYFENRPELLRKIQADLDGGTIRWKLDYLKHQLFFVPEKRNEYAILFEEYCNDIIGEVLKKTAFENPYQDIRTLYDERPEIPDGEEKVTVFLVHNLVNEYVARYVFFNQKGKKVRIQLDGRVIMGEVGSYRTHIHQRENGTFEFTSDDYTIWQNSAKNPYTALMVPVEETFHILLREHTERAIKQNLKLNAVKSMKEAERIAKNWMAIEEAIVGGVVRQLFPVIVRKYIRDLPEKWIRMDLETKSELKRYRYLPAGIEVVKRLGYQEALSTYVSNPMQFKKILLSQSSGNRNL